MVIPFTWHVMGATLGKQTSRQREKRSRLLRRAHSDKGAVVSSQLLFAAKGLDLCLEVGGPRLTGKHQLGGGAKQSESEADLPISSSASVSLLVAPTCLAPQLLQGFVLRAGMGTTAEGVLEYLG